MDALIIAALAVVSLIGVAVTILNLSIRKRE